MVENITIERGTEETEFRGVIDDHIQTIKIKNRVFDAIQTLTEPTANGEVQKILAEAMQVPCPGGRSSKAASFIERYTKGYGAFNGWLALFVATSQGRRRFLHFNQQLSADDAEEAQMLTKRGRASSDTAEAHIPNASADLDLPEEFELSEEQMNEIIDDAYKLLGYKNPARLPEEAPDLTFQQALEITQNGGRVENQ